MDWIEYQNQKATRNRPISDELAGALSYLPDMGITMKVFSGGQSGIEEGGPRTGSVRHDHGQSADVFFYKDGRKLDWANPEDVPIFQDIVAKGKERGVTGWGAGPGYMQPGSMHVGFGAPVVWGAGGKSANAPEWLVSAYNGAPAGEPPKPAPGGVDPHSTTATAKYEEAPTEPKTETQPERPKMVFSMLDPAAFQQSNPYYNKQLNMLG